MPGTLPSSAATMLFRLTGTPAWAKSLESTAWPTAMRTTSQGMTSWGWSASRGAGRPPRTSPITWGWTTSPVTLPFSSVWMATGAFRGRTSQPSAMAPSISSGRAVISAMRRRETHLTDLAPRRTEVRVASMATLPPPTTTTSFPVKSGFTERMVVSSSWMAERTPSASSPGMPRLLWSPAPMARYTLS